MEENQNIRKTPRSEEDKKVIRGRINRISGQLNGISKMAEDDRSCDDLLIQLLAVDSAVKGLANFIIERYLYTGVVDEINKGNTEILAEVINLFKRFQ